jgi:uncharacterized membrane protein
MATTTRKAKPAARKPAARKPAAKVSKPTVSKPVAKAAKPVAKKAGRSAAKFAGKAALRAVRALGRRALDSGADTIRELSAQLPDAGRRAVEAGMSRRIPIQVSIDVAVPVAVAWEEWMAFESLPEGVDRVEEIERDGDTLFGAIAGPRERDWSADIVDERPCESFAWRSTEGSDCAGLVTFHELSPRLTRIELDLDVVPTGPVQAFAFASHLAHWRAQTELRRFKARLEFINPDVYEETGEGDAPPPEESDGGDDNHDD